MIVSYMELRTKEIRNMNGEQIGTIVILVLVLVIVIAVVGLVIYARQKIRKF